MCSPSATLTLWARSWLAGDAAPDDVIDALQEWTPIHVVRAADPVVADRTGLSWPEPESASVATLLETVKNATAAQGSTVRLVLPAPGDVRDLPAGGEFAGAALDAGEGVIIGTPGTPGIGVVPRRTGAATIWSVHSVSVPVDNGDRPGLGAAEYDMREAVRGAAETLQELQRVSIDRPGFDARAAIEAEIAECARHRYPHTLSERAQRVLDGADRVAAILSVAAGQPATASVSATGAATSEDLLRPLWTTVRTARLAAYDSL